ncbi:hypothetical protein A2996_02310 [Candidatus Campbellbacteria bacterium RIFCSPLOWO2_01_FULL_34_15]|uniref:Uncharacterized protein n=2 Tax=Candidatus Campbelliibacteriota TaxID=1752727 RepID=A0A1F5EN64_9BACT|nr:MAG: hypothetical protein A2996_02310 [Candidatus Campbellbacteria bacterium RIFCSPLOWO2_01_FULL_34_15]OGD69097.1 MAG: hypothetical protein A2811_02240 [Candidatus Campbellbacteria bacterium RIFCSPHIGHO2_01_FULL_34_10]
MKKLKEDQKNNSENEVVEIVLYGDKNRKKKYECVGVLLEENSKKIKIGFNAIKGIVEDYLDIDKENIITITKINTQDIKVFE